MLKYIAAIAAIGTLAISSVAMADHTANQQRQLSWEQLQGACVNPSAFQTQRQPNAIRLTCEDTRTIWEVEQTDRVEMDNSRRIVASLSSDKFFVVKQEQAVPIGVSQTTCPRLREIQVTHTKSVSLSCQEMQAFKGNMNDFCKNLIDQDLQSNKSLATRTETGRIYDMCAAPALLTQAKGQEKTEGNKATVPSENKGQGKGSGQGTQGGGKSR